MDHFLHTRLLRRIAEEAKRFARRVGQLIGGARVRQARAVRGDEAVERLRERRIAVEHRLRAAALVRVEEHREQAGEAARRTALQQRRRCLRIRRAHGVGRDAVLQRRQVVRFVPHVRDELHQLVRGARRTRIVAIERIALQALLDIRAQRHREIRNRVCNSRYIILVINGTQINQQIDQDQIARIVLIDFLHETTRDSVHVFGIEDLRGLRFIDREQAVMAFVIGKIRDVIGECRAAILGHHRHVAAIGARRAALAARCRRLERRGPDQRRAILLAERQVVLRLLGRHRQTLRHARHARLPGLRLLRRLGIGRCGAGQSGEYRPRDDGRPAAFFETPRLLPLYFLSVVLGNHDITLHIETSI